MCNDFITSDIKGRVDIIAIMQEGIPFFIILDKLNITDICNIFTVLNDDSRIIFLEKIINTFSIVEKTFSQKSNVNSSNIEVNDSQVIQI